MQGPNAGKDGTDYCVHPGSFFLSWGRITKSESRCRAKSNVSHDTNTTLVRRIIPGDMLFPVYNISRCYQPGILNSHGSTPAELRNVSFSTATAPTVNLGPLLIFRHLDSGGCTWRRPTWQRESSTLDQSLGANCKFIAIRFLASWYKKLDQLSWRRRYSSL